jgi:hypothetical protein
MSVLDLLNNEQKGSGIINNPNDPNANPNNLMNKVVVGGIALPSNCVTVGSEGIPTVITDPDPDTALMVASGLFHLVKNVSSKAYTHLLTRQERLTQVCLVLMQKYLAVLVEEIQEMRSLGPSGGNTPGGSNQNEGLSGTATLGALAAMTQKPLSTLSGISANLLNARSLPQVREGNRFKL